VVKELVKELLEENTTASHYNRGDGVGEIGTQFSGEKKKCF